MKGGNCRHGVEIPTNMACFNEAALHEGRKSRPPSFRGTEKLEGFNEAALHEGRKSKLQISGPVKIHLLQ